MKTTAKRPKTASSTAGATPAAAAACVVRVGAARVAPIRRGRSCVARLGNVLAIAKPVRKRPTIRPDPARLKPDFFEGLSRSPRAGRRTRCGGETDCEERRIGNSLTRTKAATLLVVFVGVGGTMDRRRFLKTAGVAS